MYLPGIFVFFCLFVFCLVFVLFSKKKMFTVVPNAPMHCACMIKISTSLGLTPFLQWMEHVLFCLLLAFSAVQLLGGTRPVLFPTISSCVQLLAGTLPVLFPTSSFYCIVTRWNTSYSVYNQLLPLYSWFKQTLFHI